jgi:hypothetical protein
MRLAIILLEVVGAVLVLGWLLSALGIVAAQRRGAGGTISLADFPGVLSDAALLTVNVDVFVAALCWYGLLRKPLPTPPQPWRHKSDRS